MRIRRRRKESMKNWRIAEVYPSADADIIHNLRYLQDLADEIDASPRYTPVQDARRSG
jgi:hypothetical protein